jgi:hypothetical protein
MSFTKRHGIWYINVAVDPCSMSVIQKCSKIHCEIYNKYNDIVIDFFTLTIREFKEWLRKDSIIKSK